MRLMFCWMVLVCCHRVWAQEAISLDQCQEWAKQNYPLIRQKELVGKSKDFNIANAHSGYLPQLSINGQATYQSAVTAIPIDNPAFPIKKLSKDQYKIYGEVNQSLYDGGVIKKTTSLQETNAMVEGQRIEIELYKIKDRINQIYFGALLLDRQLEQVELLRKDIRNSLAKVEVSIENGTALKMNADILNAELLKTDQRIIEINSSRKAYLEMLGIFIAKDLGEQTVLTPTVIAVIPTDDIKRPELGLFNYQRQLMRNQYELNATKNMPRAGLFFQGGYGRPALNMLKNEFAPYYIGGLRMSWNLSGFYNASRDKQLFEINTKFIDNQQELFLFNTKMALRQNLMEIYRLQELIKVDEQLVTLRARIRETAKAQLDNGVLSASDYLRELNAEDQTKQNLLLHQVQLSLAQLNYQTTTGN